MKTIQDKARALLIKEVAKSSGKETAQKLNKWESQVQKWKTGAKMSVMTAEHIIRTLEVQK